MPELQEAMRILRALFKAEEGALAEMERARREYPPALFDEMKDDMDRDVGRRRKDIESYLVRHVLRYPFYHQRHFGKLTQFHVRDSYEDSVFIMTKFPDGDDDLSKQLSLVIKTVEQAIRDNGFKPRIASAAEYHQMLWDNVELHTLGCARGIAIVEDSYRAELNPNVAMEWGWMRAMNKTVLFLMEEGFKHDRADWQGLMLETFSWNDPEGTIPKAIRSHFERTAAS